MATPTLTDNQLPSTLILRAGKGHGEGRSWHGGGTMDVDVPEILAAREGATVNSESGLTDYSDEIREWQIHANQIRRDGKPALVGLTPEVTVPTTIKARVGTDEDGHPIFEEIATPGIEDGSSLDAPKTIPMDTSKVIYNTITGAAFKPVGKDFSVFQNDLLVPPAGFGLEPVTAATFDDGALAIMQYRFSGDAGTFEVGKGDEIQSLLTIMQGHRGQFSLVSGLATLRTECANMTAMVAAQITEDASQSDRKLKKTKHAFDRLGFWQAAVHAQIQQIAQAQGFFSTLAQCKVNDEVVDALLDYSFGSLEDAKNARRETTRNRVLDLFHGEAIGSDRPGVNGTAWGLFNAITEYATHERGVRRPKGVSEANWTEEAQDMARWRNALVPTQRDKDQSVRASSWLAQYAMAEDGSFAPLTRKRDIPARLRQTVSVLAA